MPYLCAGRYTWKDSQTVYEGSFEKNMLNGSGSYTWADGSKYEGEILDGLRHGQVICLSAYTDGIISTYTHTYTSCFIFVLDLSYEGEALDGLRHGQAVT